MNKIFTLFVILLLPHGLLFSNPDSTLQVARANNADPYFGVRWFSGSGSSLLAESTAVPFEGYDPENTNIKLEHALITGAVLTGLVTTVHIYQQNAWWQDQRTDFHFTSDPDYALNIDKYGHFFGGAVASFLGQKGMQWSGMSVESSVWTGFALGSLFELYIEYEDGFGPNWGFSPGDAYADVLGAAWPVGQYYFEPLQHIQPKYSYFPSSKFREGTHDGNAFDDYEGQTYWLGIHVDGLLPDELSKYWPDWLGIAIGASIRDMDEPSMHRNVLIALDYDMTKIIPGDSWLLNALKEGLNYIHFPSPAIRISPGFIAYGLYFY
jgi:hypothetical protein